MATREQLIEALRRADAAGDTHAATRFSEMIKASPQALATQAEPELTGRPAREARFKQQRQRKVTAAENLSALQSGQITAQDLTADQIEDIQAQRVEALPELSEIGVSGLADTKGLEGIGTSIAALTALNPEELGQILTDQFPQIGIVSTPEGIQIAVNNETGARAVINKPGISSIDIIQGLGLMSAFTPAARVTAAAPAALSGAIGRQVASQAGTKAIVGGLTAGATESGLQGLQDAAGGEFDNSEIALAAVLGGGSELIGPTARNTLNKAREAMRSGAETAEQKARRELIEQTLDTQATRAQVTQLPKDFQLQEEIAKGGGPVRQVLDIQGEQAGKVLDVAAERTGGRVATSESTPVNEILNRSNALDDQISGLYKEAREAAPTDKNITLGRVKGILSKNKGFETKSGGVLSAARSILNDKGISLAKPKTVAEARKQDISVSTSEDIRQQLNSMFPDSNPTGKRIIRALKNALDDDVLSQSGEDTFKRSRTAKKEFEEGLERAGVSKFDSRKANIVRDILENKITPDELVKKISTSKTVRDEDVRQLKNYLTRTESGTKAWNDLRAQVIDGIKGKMFSEKGDLIPAQLGKALDLLGGKSKELFTADESLLFNNLREVIRLRIPPGREVTGMGPSGAAIREVKSKFPLLGPLIEALGDYRANRFLLKLPKRLKESAPFGEINLPTAPAQVTRQDDGA